MPSVSRGGGGVESRACPEDRALASCAYRSTTPCWGWPGRRCGMLVIRIDLDGHGPEKAGRDVPTRDGAPEGAPFSPIPAATGAPLMGRPAWSGRGWRPCRCSPFPVRSAGRDSSAGRWTLARLAVRLELSGLTRRVRPPTANAAGAEIAIVATATTPAIALRLIRTSLTTALRLSSVEGSIPLPSPRPSASLRDKRPTVFGRRRC